MWSMKSQPIKELGVCKVFGMKITLPLCLNTNNYPKNHFQQTPPLQCQKLYTPDYSCRVCKDIGMNITES